MLIQVTVLANVIREKKCHLLVDLWDASFESLSLPIYCNAYLPVIEVYPEEITIQFCFINFPYNRTITLRNHSDVSAYYCIVPQQVSINFKSKYKINSKLLTYYNYCLLHDL